jgi:8-oxo-dGTP pyrophosphatase MutT (NUDIX family)
MAGVRKAQVPRSAAIRSTIRAAAAPRKSIRVSQLRKMRDCEQVAAVCYRLRRGAIEFLLVQTRGSGRWTFPKGSAEPGLTHAQAAAIEAFEEAGVHGRIEELAFTQYACRRTCDPRSASRSGQKTFAVSAHLCEVLRLCTPKESNRNRTWYSIEETKDRLREGRKNADRKEFARVIQVAVARIQRLRHAGSESDHAARVLAPQEDALQRVQFEALLPIDGRLPQPSFSTSSRRRFTESDAVPTRDSHPREFTQCEILPFGQPVPQNQKLLIGSKKMKALGTGAKS